MESSKPPTIAKKILHIFRVVFYMMRKGIISKRRLMIDLHHLLKGGKIAGKAIGNLMTFHHHHSDDSTFSSTFSCKSMDPNLSFYNPREVQFSCSDTPSYPTFHHKRRHRKEHSYDYEAAAAVAKAFEMLNSDTESIAPPSVAPSPMVVGFSKSPRMVRQLRITDSPFPIKENEVSDGKVDKEAEEFIKRFYEQLRKQPAVATPEYKCRRG